MTGVHAACVEAWIEHHRANAVEQDAPRCSVCSQPYLGSEKHPGLLVFAMHVSSGLTRQLIRALVFCAFLVVYWSAAQLNVPLWLRIMLSVACFVYVLLKTGILVVSLPQGQLPPQNCLRLLFVSDLRILTTHITEVVAIITVASLWCIFGVVPYYMYIPVVFVLLVLPMAALIFRLRGIPFSTRAWAILCILVSPLLVIFHVLRMMVNNPKVMIDPTNGHSHSVVALTVIPLCWFCPTNIPAVILWSAHMLFLILGIFDKGLFGVVKWKEGHIWWIFVYLTTVSAYVANVFQDFSEGFAVEDTNLIVLCMSIGWVVLCIIFSVFVNWALCVNQYRTWQHRHGSFTLDAEARQDMEAQTVGATEAPV